eukprot:TRINITY_DN48784_c0_g1_i1.p1 TRINITY_DN48784_c0_g1~~TRINITY_DN48784_c0_g1_i1.p1  ORF type:complete len:498 (+),score=55.13 TRINITY_DN48784_c0_g1_i1:29-1522(+)
MVSLSAFYRLRRALMPSVRSARQRPSFKMWWSQVVAAATVLIVMPAAASPPLGAASSKELSRHIVSTKLYGNIAGFGYYFTDILVGSDEQRVSVIVDTGSSDCAFPCRSCDTCGDHLDNPYDFERSTTSRKIPCSGVCSGGCPTLDECFFSTTYADGSESRGFYFVDQVKLAESDNRTYPVRATMGCDTRVNGLFRNQVANGIMGLAISIDKTKVSILEDLFRDKVRIDQRTFSLCFATWGGLFTIGGPNSAFHEHSSEGDARGNDGGLQWTGLSLSPTGKYIVKLSQLELDGVVVMSKIGPAFVDSGTTYTLLPPEASVSVRAAISTVCEKNDGCGADRDGDGCYVLRVPDDGPVLFPTFTWTFDDGASVRWPPHAYLFEQSVGRHCLGIGDMMAPISQPVLGLSWMMLKDIVFDLEKVRLGIAEASCPEQRQPPRDNTWLQVPATTAIAASRSWFLFVLAIVLGILGVALCVFALLPTRLATNARQGGRYLNVGQ